MERAIDYKTHILIGVRDNGVMTVIADWPNLPKQSEVVEEIDTSRNGYVTYVLCTPTSIMPANHNGGPGQSGYGSARGRRG
jgi:hypothetical protein